MSSGYFEEIKILVKDLHRDYVNMLQDNLEDYVDLKLEEGDSLSKIQKGLAEPSEIAKKYILYSKIYNIKGQRKLEGASNLIKEALENNIIEPAYYGSKKLALIFKGILYAIIGIAVLILGIFINPYFVYGEFGAYYMQFLSMFFLGLGLFSISQIFYLRRSFFDDLLDRAIKRCNLKDFSKGI